MHVFKKLSGFLRVELLLCNNEVHEQKAVIDPLILQL